MRHINNKFNNLCLAQLSFPCRPALSGIPSILPYSCLLTSKSLIFCSVLFYSRISGEQCGLSPPLVYTLFSNCDYTMAVSISGKHVN